MIGITHLRFYIEHSLHDLTRNGRRTLFALFCVAAGVAAIVALRTLALSIGDTLTENIARTNHGDILVSARNTRDAIQVSAISGTGGTRAFSPQSLDAINTWAKKNGVQVTSAITDVNIQVAGLSGSSVGRPQFISSLVIDPKTYPFYGPVVALDPPGVPLSKLFTGGNDVVISDNLAKGQNIKVGDQVRVSRTTEPFTVRGIVSGDEEGFRSILVLFFGFAYFDKASAKTLQIDTAPDEIYLQAPPGREIEALSENLQRAVPTINRTRTTDQLRHSNQQIADVVDRLIVSMGLTALLIGATGIIHTMLVVVRRRTVEIAVLKTIGLKGNQIALLFLVESIIMGILGSLFGIVLGLLFSVVVQAFTQQIWPHALTWRIYPQALWTGFSLGVLVTAVFGFLPTLTASRVRPAVVLRPNEAQLPASGCLQTLFALLFVIVSVGLIVGGLIGNFSFGNIVINGSIAGIIAVALTFLALGVIISILWFLVLIIGRLPAFGSVDLKLALRGIGDHRFRTATTLLALIAGMFALSTITLVSSSVPKLLNLGFQNVLGGNVLVFTPVPLLRPLVNIQLNSLQGVESFSQLAFFSGELTAVNGDRDWVSKVDLNIPSFSGTPIGDSGRGVGRFDNASIARASVGTVSGQDVTAKGYSSGTILAGRGLGPQDSGKSVLVMRDSEIVRQLGIAPGDKVMYRFSGREREYEIVGILPQASSLSALSGSLSGAATIPINAFPSGVSSTIEFTVAKVNDTGLNAALVAFSAIPGVFAIDVGFIDSLIKKLINQFTAIPTVVAVLALFAGAVIIANTVSLATLERRRQIGVMKAVGLKGRRALWVMVLENGIVGLIGGIIGVGIGSLATFLISISSGLSIFESVDWLSIALLMALSIAITLAATLLSAWTAVSEKPMNVLRYE